MRSHMKATIVIMSFLALNGCGNNPGAKSQHPTVKVTAKYPGASSENLDFEMFGNLLPSIQVVPGVLVITSVSTEGSAEVYIEGRPDLDASTLADRVKKQLRRAPLGLSSDVTLGAVEVVPGESIVLASVVREVDVNHIQIDQDRIARSGIRTSELAEALKKAGASGRTPQEIENIVVQSENGAEVRVGDIADVKTVREPDRVVRRWPATSEDKRILRNR